MPAVLNTLSLYPRRCQVCFRVDERSAVAKFKYHAVMYTVPFPLEFPPPPKGIYTHVHMSTITTCQ